MPESAATHISLTTPLTEVRRIRPDLAAALARLEIVTVADLIRYLPTRYERQEAESPISALTPGAIGTARGEITATRIVAFGKRPRFEVVLADHTGRLDVVWFNQTYLKQRLFPGLRLLVQGQPRRHGPGLQMVNPRWELIGEAAPAAPGQVGDPDPEEPEAREAHIRPVYSATEHITSRQIERVVDIVLHEALKQIDDHLPPEFRKKRSLPELREAYRMAHQPETLEESREATRRLAFDELLLLQLGVFLRREQQRATVRAPALQHAESIERHIRERFPFSLTRAQERVIKEIVEDLTHADPANRLIQGDVGSGKTVVALYAMLVAVANKQQAALMAPTELLAEQHYLSITQMLKGSDVKVELLVGALSETEKLRIRSRLAAGDIDILIGTHALYSESVRFDSLAVAVIDEQHRFGVHQRAALRSKGSITAEDAGNAEDSRGLEFEPKAIKPKSKLPSPASPASSAVKPLAPHVLVMTATPIPRTLGLTLLGDLDISVIDELPPGRSPIATRVVESSRSGEVYQYIHKRLDEGEQAYIVVPMIDGGASALDPTPDSRLPTPDSGDDLNDLRTVVSRLEAGEFKGKRVAALHGRLKRDTREAIMARFRSGAIDALVATTVIEVGVDVPNATMMVVEHAERFGLAQLHQLRGRVGRGSKKSLCVLLWSAGASGEITPDAQARLTTMAATTDGFEIAEKDLDLRGPGEVFGWKQAGAPPFRVADLQRDKALLALARRDALQWIKKSPTLHAPGEDLLRKRLLKQHGAWLGLADIG